MLLDLRLDVPPAVQPVTLDELKAHTSVETGDFDATLQIYLDASVSWLDGYSGVLGRALIAQSWILSLDHFPGRHLGPSGLASGLSSFGRAHRRRRHPHRIHLPLPPLISVDQVAYVDPAGVDQVLATDQYVVIDGPIAGIDPAPNVIFPATRTQARAVTISFTCGYGAAGTDVPGALRNAILMLAAHWFETREAVVGIDQRGTPMPTPLGVAELIAGFKVR